MMRRLLPLTALAVLVALAGCTGPGGGQPTESTPDIVEISGPECTVGDVACAQARLTKYNDDVQIRVAVDNNGESEITVHHGSPITGPDGANVMVASCNVVEVEEDGFDRRAVGPNRVRVDDPAANQDGFDQEDRVTLAGGESLQLTWDLHIPDSTSISRLGYRCPLAFQVNFSQIIQAERQVQIKRDQSVPDVSSVDYTATSERPVRLEIDAPTSFVAADGKPLVVEAYLRDVAGGSITTVKDIEAQSGTWLKDEDEVEFAAGDDPCNKDVEILMYRSKELAGESYRRRCTVIPSLDANTDSEINWLSFTAEYTYKMPLSDVELVIDPVEGE